VSSSDAKGSRRGIDHMLETEGIRGLNVMGL
jgi:hypothetical protein